MTTEKRHYWSFGKVELWYDGEKVREAEMNTNHEEDANKAAIVKTWKQMYGQKFFDPKVILKTILYDTAKKVYSGHPGKTPKRPMAHQPRKRTKDVQEKLNMPKVVKGKKKGTGSSS